MLQRAIGKLALALLILTISFTSHAQNQALDLSGVGNEVNVTYDLTTGPGFTVEQWVYFPVITSGAPLVNQTNSNFPSPLDAYVVADGSVNLLLGNGTASFASVSSAPGAITPATWHHVALVYDPAASGSEGQIFIDGVSSPVATVAEPAGFANTGPTRIGRRADAFEGDDIYIDEVRIWNVARTGIAINGDYDAKLAGDETGLQVYLQFENNLNDDATGNGSQDGTIAAGSIGYTPGAPLQNNALNFDSFDDNVSMARNTLSTGLTFEAWVNTVSADAASGYTGNAALSVIGDVDNNIRGSFGINGGEVWYLHWTGTNTDFDTVRSVQSVNDGTWHHIAVTHDQGSNEVLIYVDGQLDGQGITSTYHGDMAFNRIGSSFNTGVVDGDFFDGSIDEVRVWDNVRNQEQINADAYSTLSAGSGLVASYDFNQGVANGDNGSYGNLPDLTINGNNGTLNGPFTLNFAASNWVTSAAFDNDVFPPIFLAGFPLVDNIGTTGFDITVQLNEPGTYFYVVVPDGASAPSVDDVRGGTGFGGSGELDADNILVTTASTNFVLNASGLTSGTDYDVYLVAQDDEGSPNVQNNNSFFDVTTATPPLAPTNLIAYATSATAITLEWMDNATDETGYNVERDISSAFGSPLVVGNGLPANTQSFVDNAGTDQRFYYRIIPTNGNEDSTSYSATEFGTTIAFAGDALTFDGIDDRVSIADDDSLSFGNGTTDSPFAVEAWINLDQVNSQGIVSKRSGTNEWHMVTSGSGQLSITLADNSASAFLFGETTGFTFQTGEWYHVAFSYNGNGLASGIRLFINGVEYANNPSSSGSYTAMENTSSPLEIGTLNSGASFNFDGQIDELRIWSFEKIDYSDRFSQPQGNEANLIAYFSMDEGSGLNVLDGSVNTNDGTLQNGPTFTASTIVQDGVVSNTNDAGPGSLREAINYANANSPTTITFNIPGAGPHTISVTTTLPDITGAGTIIDGASQPGWTFGDVNNMVSIDGSGIGSNSSGFNINEAPDVEIYGLIITGFSGLESHAAIELTGDGADNVNIGAPGMGNIIHAGGTTGIYITNSDSTVIQGNWIGTLNGTTPSGNNHHGISATGTVDDLTIGGNSLIGEGNLIAGAGNGRYGITTNITGTNLSIKGNLIGTDSTGNASINNEAGGIDVGGAVTFAIGGVGPGERNVISGNNTDTNADGINIGNSPTGSILNNYIGVGENGSTPLGNGGYGILFANSASNVLVDGNIISNNGTDGLYLGNGSSTLTVSNNLIGLTSDGLDTLGNANDGIRITNGTNITISGNTISANGSDGIAINGDQTNLDINSNIIGLDINGVGDMILSGDGVTVTSDNTFGNHANGIVLNLVDGASAGNSIIGNLISGNGVFADQNSGSVGIGIYINADTRGFTIQDNVIGLAGDEITPQKNINSGIYISGLSNSVIGGVGANEANLIGHNGDYGIEKLGTQMNDVAIHGNEFDCNEKGGISFTSTPDIDAPIINLVSPSYISGTTTAEDNSNIFIYEADSCNIDQGRLLVADSIDVVSGGTWTVNGSFQLGKYYVAIVEDDETAVNATLSTSEFSLSDSIPASVVTNSNDSGAGSLRDAIAFANANPGTAITFDIPGGGPWVIGLATALPQITANNIIIDGTTQPGWTFGDTTAMVQINGSGIGSNAHGINIDADQAEVYGLILTGFLGSSLNGTINLASASAGNAQIGASGKGNIIHGTGGNGIYIQGADSVFIQGNWIGTSVGSDTSAVGNHGIATAGTSDNLTIGGDLFTGEGNVISGSGASRYGINIFNGTTIVISGNYIGTNANADAAIANGLGGISIGGSAADVTIGGPSPGDLNIISGNTGDGIRVQAGNDININGNYIGIQSDGSSALGNGQNGIQIESAPANINIGDINQNIISENIGDGIFFNSNLSSNTALGANIFSCNQGGGIGYGSAPLIDQPLIDNITATSAIVSSTSGDGSSVTLWLSQDGCSNDQGLTQVGFGTVASGEAVVSGIFVSGQHYTAYVEDINGTSEFASPFVPNFVAVTNENDTGAGSLRAAIDSVNVSPGKAIYFNIPSSAPWEINLASDLPDITAQGTIIDGTTQAGWNIAAGDIPQIIGGGSQTIGLNFTANLFEVYGLHIRDFTAQGIRFNAVGTTADGYIIGAPDKGNIITGNSSAGVFILTYVGGGTVQSNYIGIMPDGTTAGMGNQNGISLGTNGDRVQIGGLSSDEMNVISNNTTAEISISNADSTIIQGNLLGLDPLETTAFGAGNGINMTPGNGALIEGNVISGHTTGIRFNNSSGNIVRGNAIGLASDASTPFPNTNGIHMINNLNSDNNIIGSANNSGDANYIGENTTNAILIEGSGNNGNQIQRNSIFNNGAGITLNSGAHNGIIPPVIDPIVSFDSISGSGTNGDIIDLYLTDAAGQGQTFLDSTMVSGGVWGIGSLALTAGEEVVATATNISDGTSEFSVAEIAPGSIVTNTNDTGTGSLREAINYANANPGTTIVFDIQSAAPWVITRATPLPTITADGTIIDGFTQDGFNFTDVNQMVQLDGQGSGTGLQVQGNNVEIYGLNIYGFTQGILYFDADRGIIGAQGRPNIIGNSQYGIWLGGTGGSDSTIIEANYIGVDYQGNNIANTNHGIRLSAGSNANKIGAEPVADQNIIANNNIGIYTQGAGTQNNEFIGNIMYCNATAIEHTASSEHDAIDIPIITLASLTELSGTVTAADGDLIRIYRADTLCVGNNPQILVGDTTVTSNAFTFSSPLIPGADYVAILTSPTLGSGEPSATATALLDYGNAEGAGEALTFDGIDDFVELPTIDVTSLNAITVEAWIKPNDIPNGPGNQYATIVGKGSYGAAGTNSFSLYLFGSDGSPFSELKGRIDNGSTVQEVTYDANNFNTGEWVHVALSWNSGDPVNLYVNGELVDSSAPITGPLNSIGDSVRIGSSTHGGELFFEGEIDEVKIWDSAVSEDGMRQYLARKVTNAHPDFANLLAYYRMDDSVDALNLQDFKGIHNGIINGGSSYTLSGAHLGDDSFYEYIYTAGSGRDLGSFRVQNLGVPNLPLHIYRINQTPSVNTVAGFDNIDDAEYFGVFAPGQTYDVNDSIFAVSPDRRILYRADGTDPAWTSISGVLGTDVDDDQIYAYGQMGSGQFTTAIDQNPYPTPVDAGHAMSFDGAADYITVPHSPSIDFSGDFTVETWINPDGSASPQGIVSKFNNEMVLWLDASTLRYEIGGGAQANCGTIPSDEWTHVALTYDGTNARVYVNGLLVHTNPETQPNTSTRNVFIGSWDQNEFTTRNFVGDIDEVRIWDIPLTQNNIRDHMIGKMDADFDSLNHLQAYFRFDENNAPTATNIAGDSDGTITGATPVISGAPRGSGSLYSYAGTPGVLNTAQFGEDINIYFDDATGGIHGYLVEGAPNQVQASGFDDLDQGKYFGVFAPGGQKVDIRMDYNDGIDANRRIVYRKDASDTSAVNGWERLSGLINTSTVADSVFAYNVPSGEVSTAVLNPPSTYPVLGDTDAGTALDFDGTNDYVRVSHTETLNLEFDDAFSIEAWVNAPASGTMTLVSKVSSGPTRGYRITINSQIPSLQLFNDGGASNELVVSTVETIPLAQWSHLVVTYDGSNTAAGVSFYLDGVLLTNSVANDNLSGTIQHTSDMFIGIRNDITSPYQGQVDELRIWNAELSAGDITAFANTTDISLHPNYSEMIAYYKFDDGLGSNTLLDVFSNNDGMLFNMDDATDWVGSGALSLPPPVQNALDFDGTDDYVDIGQNVYGGPYTGSFTVEAWVYSDLVGNNLAPMGSGIFKNMESGSGAIGDLALTINDAGQIGLLNWRVASTDPTGHSLTNDSIPANTWTHVAATWDGATNRIFINGVEQTLSVSGTSSGWGAGYGIGRVHTATQWHYDGQMDEVRVWQVARSETEINDNLYNELDPGSETDLVAYYQFNESSGTSLPDLKGSNDGTWSGAAGSNATPNWIPSDALTPAQLQNALALDGTGDFTNSGNISAVNFDQFDPFTIEAWIQTTGTGLQTIAGQQEDAGGGTGYRIFLQDSLFRMSLNNTSGSDQLAVNADGSSINDGQWHHVAVTHDGSGTAAGIGLFIDGEKYPNLIVQDNLTSSTVSAANFSIGSRNGVQHYFNGLIEQVRVWDIDRSAEEIYTNADSSIASDPNLILAFEFDQDSAAAIDAIGGNDGALNGDANYVSSTAFDNDIFAPLFTSGYPFVDDITENDFQINSNANETGLLGVAVYADGTPTPTSDDVVNGTGAITFASALSESAITRIGGSLNPGTDYDVYFVLEDLIGNRQHIPTLVDVTTSAASNLALEFDGSAQYVAVPDAPQFDLDSDWTIEAWIKTPSTGQQNIVGQIAGTTGYSFFKIGGTLYLQYYSSGGFQNGGTSLSVAAGIDDDQWHHVAVSQNGSNGKIYVDGSPVLDVNVLLPIDETTDEVRIGYDEFVGAFTGSIDEVRFWDYQRSDSEIFDHHDSKLFGSESGLVAYYPFDDGSPSTIATDATGNGNDGNLTSMDENTDWVVGPALSPAISAPQNALNFDGTDDYIEVPDNPTLDITTEVTVSAWLRIDGNTGSIQNAVRKNDNYLLGWIPADYSRFEAQVFVGSQWESIQSTLTPTDLENEWHHFAMTYDGSTLSLYVDGILDNQVPLSGTMNVTADPLHLGSVSFAVQEFFNGSMDEVRIWNVALNGQEIFDYVYASDLSGHPNQANLVLHYGFDQGVAGGNNSAITTEIDQSSNALDGTLNDFALSGGTSNYIASGIFSHSFAAPATQATNLAITNVTDTTADVSWTNGDGQRRLVVVHDGTGNPFPSPSDNIYGNPGDYGLGDDIDGGWFVVYNGYNDSTVINGLSAGTDYEVAVVEVNGPPNYEMYNINSDVDNPNGFTTTGGAISNFALDFDGINDHAQVTSPTGFPVGAAPRTLEFWFKSNVDLSSDTDHGIVQYGTSANDQMFGLITTLNAPGRLYFFGFANDLGGITNLVQDQWYHAAVTYDGTNINLYLDGNLEATTTATLNTVIDGNGLTIGRRPDNGNQWDGQLDEIRLWDHARSQTDIQNNMNNELLGNEAGLVAYYPLSDGTGSTTVTDETGGTNGANLVSMDANTDWVEGPTLSAPTVPDATLTTIDVPGISIDTASNDNLVYKFSVTASGGNLTKQGFQFGISGDATSADFSAAGWKIHESVNVDEADPLNAGFVNATEIGEFIADTVLFTLSGDILNGDTHYFYVLVDVDAAATIGNSFNIALMTDPVESFGIVEPKNKIDGGFIDGNTFTIQSSADVAPPNVVNLSPDINTITDGDTQFNVTITFDEAMDTGIDPTISFPVEDPANTLTFSVGGWDDNLNFTASYSVADANELLSNVDVQVTDARDLAGNLMGVYDATDVFNIDTENPVVTVDVYATSITSPQLTGSIDDPSATLDVEVDGVSYSGTNNGDGTWTLVAGAIAALSDGTYDVIVTATDDVGNIGSDATLDELIISQSVVTIAPVDVTSTGFTARWSQGLDVLTYQIDVSDVADFSTFVPGFQGLQTTATGIVVSNLDFATQYYYRVRLVNSQSQVSANSNTTQVKTAIDLETEADSLALVQIFNAIAPQGLNWPSARLRNWDGVTLDISRTRVEVVDISGTGAAGNMPNPFTGNALANGGLSNMLEMNASDNQITGLMDYSGTAITSLNVSTNNLEFDDLEPVAAISSVDYSNQASVQFNESAGAPIEVRYTNDYSLSISTGGSSNVYTWFRNDVQINSSADFIVNNATSVILAIDYDNMGTFRTEVTNPLVPGLTIDLDPQDVLAIADMQVSVTDANGDPLSAPMNGFMLETTRTATGFSVLETLENVNSSTFTFPDVVLGNYIILVESDLGLYIPTYFGNVFEWTEADTLFFRSDDVIDITMTEVPPELTAADGEGLLDVLIEEDFGDDGGRIDARRRASKRKCGLRRKRSGGRTGQDDDEFELIAYGETDDNGEFQFGFLPQGIYRFFVEYPGIPLDESSFVQFEVGEAGVSDTDFRLQAFATEDGVEVTIEAVLGIILEYFKDLEIYPNPSSDYLNIRYRHLKSGDITAQLVDLLGKTKWSEDLRNGFNGQLRIDVADFEEGVYILRFYDRESPQDNVVSFRVIVKD